MNKTVMHALNRCTTTGLETLVRDATTPDGKHIKLFKDHKGWHRIVAFKSEAHSVGCSGVIVQPCGEIYYKETCPDMRSNGLTRQLQAMLTVWGVKWFPSQFQTKGGAACYKY
jgi:hypothetical protein